MVGLGSRLNTRQWQLLNEGQHRWAWIKGGLRAPAFCVERLLVLLFPNKFDEETKNKNRNKQKLSKTHDLLTFPQGEFSFSLIFTFHIGISGKGSKE